MRSTAAAGLVAALLLHGCSGSRPLSLESTAPPAVEFATVDNAVADEPAMEALVAPYRSEMAALTSEVIGTTSRELTKDRPEGTLGNFAADALLWAARRSSDSEVHFALTNNGGLRTTVGPGDITVGRIFELMPFENMVTLLELTASQVDSLASQLARNGGDPVAGINIVFDSDARALVETRIGGADVHPDSTYVLATSDYLANGGGPYEILWNVERRRDLPLLIRDAFIDYVRATRRIEPAIEGRIRNLDADGR